MQSAGRRHVRNQERSNIRSDLSKINQPHRARFTIGALSAVPFTDRPDRTSGFEPGVSRSRARCQRPSNRKDFRKDSDSSCQGLTIRVEGVGRVLIFRTCDRLAGTPHDCGSQLPRISTPRKCLILWGVIPTLVWSLCSFLCQRARAVAALGHSRPGTRSRSSVLSSGNRQSLRQ